MIDIIIPCYNSHATIDRCIGSILAQRVLPEIQVTLVNDAGKDYKDVIKRYSSIMNIREIGYDVNGGPAKSRNYGLKNTKEDLVMFMDSDDALASPFSVVLMCNEMYSDPNNAIVISNFLEEVAPLKVKIHDKDTSFMHGKMYKRSFLEKYDISQNEKTRCNEDVGFNILALLIANDRGYGIKYFNYISYYWLFNPSSLVRSDKENYDHSTSFRGFANNLTYVFEELQKRNIDSYNILNEKATTMQRLYLLYKERTDGYPQFKEGNLKVLQDYYNKIYKHVENKITEKMFNSVYKALPFKGDEGENKRLIREFIKELR